MYIKLGDFYVLRNYFWKVLSKILKDYWTIRKNLKILRLTILIGRFLPNLGKNLILGLLLLLGAFFGPIIPGLGAFIYIGIIGFGYYIR